MSHTPDPGHSCRSVRSGPCRTSGRACASRPSVDCLEGGREHLVSARTLALARPVDEPLAHVGYPASAGGAAGYERERGAPVGVVGNGRTPPVGDGGQLSQVAFDLLGEDGHSLQLVLAETLFALVVHQNTSSGLATERTKAMKPSCR